MQAERQTHNAPGTIHFVQSVQFELCIRQGSALPFHCRSLRPPGALSLALAMLAKNAKCAANCQAICVSVWRLLGSRARKVKNRLLLQDLVDSTDEPTECGGLRN